MTLEENLRRLGCVDLDVGRLAPEGLSPDNAAADLRRRFPGAFRDARRMTEAEAEVVRRDALAQAQKMDAAAGMRRFWRDAKARMPSIEIPEEYR